MFSFGEMKDQGRNSQNFLGLSHKIFVTLVLEMTWFFFRYHGKQMLTYSENHKIDFYNNNKKNLFQSF